MENSLVTQGDFMLESMLDVGKFEQLQRAATLFSKSNMVPKSFRENPAACFVGLQLAVQLGTNPFMLMQRIYTFGDKIGIEAQLAIAIVNKKGLFKNGIRWKPITGSVKNKDMACTAYAEFADTGEVVEMTIDWGTVEKEGWASKANSKWPSMPEQMFRFRTAMWLIRAYAPEALLGMYSTDELQDSGMINVTPRKTIDEAFAELQEAKPVEAEVVEIEPVEKPKKTPPQKVKTVKPEDVADFSSYEKRLEELGFDINKTGAVYVVRALGQNKPMSEWTAEDYEKVIANIEATKK